MGVFHAKKRVISKQNLFSPDKKKIHILNLKKLRASELYRRSIVSQNLESDLKDGQ